MCKFIDPQIFRRSDAARVTGQNQVFHGDPSHGNLDAPEILAGGTTNDLWGFIASAYQDPIYRN